MQKNVAALIGSGSKNSFNRLAVLHVQRIAPPSLRVFIAPIDDLPLYDRDRADAPAYDRLRKQIAAADAVIWATPEHNGAPSAMLKNAIDVCSSPAERSVWIGKPLGLMSVNAAGSKSAVDQLRAIGASYAVNMPTLPVAACIGGIYAGAFDASGNVVCPKAQRVLRRFVEDFADFVMKF